MKEQQDKLEPIKMKHCTNNEGIDFMYELQNKELKVLVRYEYFTINSYNELVTSKSLPYPNDNTNMNQENEN